MIIEIKELGMFINVVRNTIFYCVVGIDGKPETRSERCLNMEEMNCPKSQEILDIINNIFFTNFSMRQFYPHIYGHISLV